MRELGEGIALYCIRTLFTCCVDFQLEIFVDSTELDAVAAVVSYSKKTHFAKISAWITSDRSKVGWRKSAANFQTPVSIDIINRGR